MKRNDYRTQKTTIQSKSSMPNSAAEKEMGKIFFKQDKSQPSYRNLIWELQGDAIPVGNQDISLENVGN